MLAGAKKSLAFSCLVLLIIMSASFAVDDCPACADFLNNPNAKVLITADETTHIADIVIYYENSSATPSRQPVSDSIVIVELTNATGLKYLYKTYTDSTGKATFDFTQWSGACVNIKALYCPFCTGIETECGFAQCLGYAKIHNESYYTNIPHAITKADDIDVWGSAPVPSPFNPKRYFPDLSNVLYCAPPQPNALTPALCLPLIIIFSLLSGAMYMTGRNPFAAFNIGGARVGRHIRYQARGRGFSMNVMSLATAVSSAVKVGKAAAAGKLGEKLKAEKAPGLLATFGGPLSKDSKSGKGLAAHREISAIAGKDKAAYARGMDVKGGGGSTRDAQMQMRGGQMVPTGGGGGGVRASDLLKGGGGLNWGAIGRMVFSATAIGRIVDSYNTISGKSMWESFVAGKSVERAGNDLAAMNDRLVKGVGVKVMIDDGKGGQKVVTLASQKETIGADGRKVIECTYIVDGKPRAVAGGTAVITSETVKFVQEMGADGRPVMKKDSVQTITVNGLDVKAKEVPVMEGGKQKIVDGKPATETQFFVTQANGEAKQVRVELDKDTKQPAAILVDGQKIALPSNTTVMDGKLVGFEPQMRLDSVSATMQVTMKPGEAAPGAGAAAPKTVEVNVTLIAGSATKSGESVVTAPSGFKVSDSMSEGFKGVVRDATAETLNKNLVPSNNIESGRDAAKSLLGSNNASMEFLNAASKSFQGNISAELDRRNEELKVKADKDPVIKADYEARQTAIAKEVIGDAFLVSTEKGKPGAPSYQESLVAGVKGGEVGAIRLMNDSLGNTILVNDSKRTEASAGIGEKAGVPAAVVSIAMGGVIGNRPLGDLANMKAEEAKTQVNAALDNAVAARLITPDQAKAYKENPTLQGQVYSQVNKSANDALTSIGGGSNLFFKTEAAKLPVGEINHFTEGSKTIGLDKPGGISGDVYNKRVAGFDMPPEIRTMAAERDHLLALGNGARQVEASSQGGNFSESTMHRVESLNRHMSMFAGAAGASSYTGEGGVLTVDRMAPPGATPEVKSYVADQVEATRTQLVSFATKSADVARAEERLFNPESNPFGPQDLTKNFAARQDKFVETYSQAVSAGDYRSAYRIARQGAEFCADTGVTECQEGWKSQATAASSLYRDTTFRGDKDSGKTFEILHRGSQDVPGGIPSVPGDNPGDTDRKQQAERDRILASARSAGSDPAVFGGKSEELGKRAEERYRASYREYQGHLDLAATNLEIMTRPGYNPEPPKTYRASRVTHESAGSTKTPGKD